MNKIIHADCLPILNELPEKSVDFIITDPPYGMKYHSGYYKYGNPHSEIAGDDRYPYELIPIFKKIARKGVFCFCRWDNLKDVPTPNSFIVWVKNNWSAGDLNKDFGRMWEGILFYALDDFSFNKRIPDVIDARRISPDKLKHPTEKPVELLKHIVRNCTQANDVILDPFTGSGSILVAAKELNRQYIGIELEKKYVDIAESRLTQQTMGF